MEVGRLMGDEQTFVDNQILSKTRHSPRETEEGLFAMFSLEDDDDDEYSSGSSVDLSQLMGDWKQDQPDNPSTKPDETAATTTGEEVSNAKRQEQSDTLATSVDTSDAKKSVKGKVDGNRIKVVMGQSVLDWQSKRRDQNLAPFKVSASEFMTIRQDAVATTKVPLENAEITLTPPTAKISTTGETKLTGKCICSKAPNYWVECVAVYNERRKCHVLEIVQYAISNLKPRVEPPPSVTTTAGPQEQLRQAEQRLLKRKAEASTTRKTRTPKTTP